MMTLKIPILIQDPLEDQDEEQIRSIMNNVRHKNKDNNLALPHHHEVPCHHCQVMACISVMRM